MRITIRARRVAGQLGWMVLLWSGGVAALGAVALVLRTFLKP